MYNILPPLERGDKWIEFGTAFVKLELIHSTEFGDGIDCFELIPENGKFEDSEITVINSRGLDWMLHKIPKINDPRGLFGFRWRVNAAQARRELFEQPDPGFIYLVRTDNEAYKIGKSTDVQSRLGSLRTDSPMNVELVHDFFAIDYTERERELHEHYAHRRIKGEWFALTEQDIAEIMAITDED